LLMGSDKDSFNRWDASQRLSTRLINRLLAKPTDLVAGIYLKAIERVLADDTLDSAIKAEVLSLPSLDTLAEAQELVDYEKLYQARLTLKNAIASCCKTQLQNLVKQQLGDSSAYQVEHQAIAKRKLANCALDLLTTLPESDWLSLADKQYRSASNMTDRMAGMSALMQSDHELRDSALADFYTRFEQHRLVIDKWFSVQVMTPQPGIIDKVQALSEHPAFDLSNPNRVRSLISAFAVGNPVSLHREKGRGYRLLADYVLTLDSKNPQIAARLIGPLTRWQRFVPENAQLMKAELERIAKADVSPDVYEIVSKSLDA